MAQSQSGTQRRPLITALKLLLYAALLVGLALIVAVAAFVHRKD